MISWEVGDGVFWSRSVSFKIACISLPVKPLIYNISIYWQGCRTRLSWGETQIPKRWALIVQVIIYWPRHYYSPWGYAFASRLLRGCTLGVRPECGHWDSNSQSNQQEPPREGGRPCFPKDVERCMGGLDLNPALEAFLLFLEYCKILSGPNVCLKRPQIYVGRADELRAWSWEISTGLCIQRCVTRRLPLHVPFIL